MVAVPAAGIVLATGAISLEHAWEEVVRIGPVIGFLAAILVLAQLCDVEGLFRASGSWMARLSGPHPRSLLASVFVVASIITAVLSLDATVVLLTPVVFTNPSNSSWFGGSFLSFPALTRFSRSGKVIFRP